MKHKDLFLSRGYCNLNDHKVGIPRYFREKIGVENLALIKPKNKKQFEEEQRSFLNNIKIGVLLKVMISTIQNFLVGFLIRMNGI